MKLRRGLLGVLIALGVTLQLLAALGVVRVGTPTYVAAAVTLLLVVGVVVDVVRLDRLELLITLRYLRSRRASRLLSLITVIAVGGVTVGVMALVVVLGVMNGLQADLRDKILVANPHLRVLTYGEGLRLDDWRKILDSVRRTPGVEAAAPFVLTQGLISAGHDYAEGVVVYGVEPDTGRRAVTSFARHFTKGDLRFQVTRPDVEGGIALGTRLANKLSAFPGDPGDIVTLVAPAGARFNPSLGAYVPQFHRYEVTGIFDTGMFEYDNSYVALDRRVAQRFAGLDTAVTGVEVRLHDPWEARTFAGRLEARLGYPYRALDWQSQNASLFSALKLEKLAMALVVFLICVVAAFNVVGTLTMVVRDKTREIGILLAMGLKQAAIRRIFLAQGILIGLTGTALGVALGLVLGGMVNRGHWIPIDPSIYFVDHLPVRTQPLDVLVVIAASLVVAALAPLYPSLQAARLDPVTAIRYE
jgi:lipoprotein-releasing system permease protein